MTTEILLAVFQNLKFAAGLVLIIGGIIAVMGSVIAAVEEINEVKAAIRKRVWILVVAGIIACIPCVDDLWKVRIGLIKLQLASPENISKGTEAITRIAAELECKYLGTGCPKEKK